MFRFLYAKRYISKLRGFCVCGITANFLYENQFCENEKNVSFAKRILAFYLYLKKEVAKMMHDKQPILPYLLLI